MVSILAQFRQKRVEGGHLHITVLPDLVRPPLGGIRALPGLGHKLLQALDLGQEDRNSWVRLSYGGSCGLSWVLSYGRNGREPLDRNTKPDPPIIA